MKTSVINDREYAELSTSNFLQNIETLRNMLPEAVIERVDYGHSVTPNPFDYDDLPYIKMDLDAAENAWKSGMYSESAEHLAAIVRSLLPNVQPVVTRTSGDRNYEPRWAFGGRASVFYGDELKYLTTSIHCDPLVLHKPGVCEFCDLYGEKEQKYRMDNNINFTGDHTDVSQLRRPDPAELERGDMCQVWGGNVPSKINETTYFL